MKWLKNFFTKKNKFENTYSYFLLEKQKLDDKLSQQIEDDKITFAIRRAARELFNEWENAPEITIGENTFKNCLLIIKPFVDCYNVSDTESARYLNTNINELVMVEFNELKKTTRGTIN